jgi:dolichyl-phosphate beta-glucosyltransferase
VLASRIRMLGRHIERTPMRHYLGRVFATIASMTLRLPIYDSQCGAKVFRNIPALHQALSQPMTTRWTFDVELLQRLLVAGVDPARMSEMPLQAWADRRGGTLGITAMIGAGRELLRLWWQSKRR